MRAFLDTNILIDYFGRRSPYFNRWGSLRAMQVFGDVELWVAPQSFADTFYILRGEASPEQLQASFRESLEFLNVCDVGMAEVDETASRCWKDYEDCLIALCAENMDADVLLSRDESGFKESKVPVYSLDGFFRMLESEYGLVYEDIEL